MVIPAVFEARSARRSLADRSTGGHPRGTAGLGHRHQGRAVPGDGKGLQRISRAERGYCGGEAFRTLIAAER
jgi:hypothetical protein